MKKKLALIMAAALAASALLAGCGNGGAAQEAANTEDTADADTGAAEDSSAEDTANEDAAADSGSDTEEAAGAEADAQQASAEKVVLKCVCDLTPHSEILESAKDALAAEGIELDIVSTTWDATWNDKLTLHTSCTCLPWKASRRRWAQPFTAWAAFM